ncbi:MAG: ATP-binding protein [Proteobacteria bacterium]|nr:ATP-binding protein [Pseudomonadota bacterium]
MTTVWFSLRRRLLLPLLGGVTLLWLAMLVSSYLDAHHEIDELLDAQLAHTAQTMLALASHEALEGDEGIAEVGETAGKDGHDLRFQIWAADGALLLRSHAAPRTPLTAHEGFSESADQSGRWRLYMLWDKAHTIQVQVGEDLEDRDDLIVQVAWKLLLPALIGLPLLGGWVWFATRRGLAPLNALAAQIDHRDPAHLEALIPVSAPTEIKPVLEALNGLFGRVKQVLGNERRFTADDAHELRTPLAALAAQAQVAQRSENDAERQHAIEQLRVGVDRAAHLIDQLLTLARLDPEQPLSGIQAVRLRLLAEEVSAAHGAAAVAKHISLELDAVDVEVRGNATMLQILLRNLLDNAIRYTPAGGLVRVVLSQTESRAVLRVCDSGPGIPAAEREAVFQRFHRGNAGQDQVGSGLGLSIVQRIAELHGASIALAEGETGQGLCVSVSFSPQGLGE